jgi:6-pyruvoyltetrahydropterin/6-carboxytetrahydropterin synthase
MTHKETPEEYYGITKAFYFKASHNGNFKDTKHVDNQIHEHDWKVIYRCKARELSDENVVTDFRIAEKIEEQLEGKYLNGLEVFKGEIVTAEFLAKWIIEQIPKCFFVEVFETEDNIGSAYKNIDW